MSRGSGHRLFKEIDFREDAPPTGNAPVGSTRPSPDRQAHPISEDGLKLKLSSTAKSVLSEDEAAEFMAALERGRR